MVAVSIDFGRSQRATTIDRESVRVLGHFTAEGADHRANRIDSIRLLQAKLGRVAHDRFAACEERNTGDEWDLVDRTQREAARDRGTCEPARIGDGDPADRLAAAIGEPIAPELGTHRFEYFD